MRHIFVFSLLNLAALVAAPAAIAAPDQVNQASTQSSEQAALGTSLKTPSTSLDKQNASVQRVESPTPEKLLAQMSTALETMTYSGEFTYQYGRQIESYKIAHHVDGERVYESLQSLTGKDQRISRLGSAECGTIGSHLLAGARLSSPSGPAFGVELVYHARVIAQDRVAGRDAWVVELAPKDEYRFGLVLAIDQLTFLPLRHFVYDARKSVALEHTQFVSIKLDKIELVDESAVSASPERCVTDTYSPDGHSPWKPTWLPPGFILTGYKFHSDDGHMETYTDGISSFSIFVKPGVGGQKSDGQIQQSVASKGATMALMSARGSEGELQHISVVGEVPLSVAQKVSLSVRPVTNNETPSGS